jgi:5-methylcytosine-specific restriction protein A
MGGHYVRKELHNQFRGGRQSGISSPKGEDFVFIFTGPSGEKYGYEDEFLDDGTLLYFGQGVRGDMEFTKNNGNTKIRDHKERGYELYVFEETSESGVMCYVGEYEYVDHDWVTAPDRDGNDREAIRFRLEPKGGVDSGIDVETTQNASEEELFELAKRSAERGSEDLDSNQGTSSGGGNNSQRRSEVVRQFALKTANGVCQGCDEDAPFRDSNRKPFLEVHQLQRLSDGGPDRPENVIALCPNCHRRRHEGQDGDEFNQDLIAKAEKRNQRFLD